MSSDQAAGTAGAAAPRRSGLVLLTLILVASVANLNLAVANVALPDIGDAFAASQTQLDLIAVGYSLGLAASVLYFGAIGDRYGRKLMLILGMAISLPAALLAAFAPSAEVLFGARLLGGLAAGMAYPTTLALITALWSGSPRTRAIALWSGIGGAMSALGSLVAGALLLTFAWGSVFLVTIPLAVAGLILAIVLVPAHVNETKDRVDNLGGVVSILFVAALVLAINFAPEPGMGTRALVLGGIALAAGTAFLRGIHLTGGTEVGSSPRRRSRPAAPGRGARVPREGDAASPTQSGRSRSPGPLQAQRRDAVLARGEQPAGGEPYRERGARAVEDGARRHRGTVAAPRAHEAAIAEPPAWPQPGQTKPAGQRSHSR